MHRLSLEVVYPVFERERIFSGTFHYRLKNLRDDWAKDIIGRDRCRFSFIFGQAWQRSLEVIRFSMVEKPRENSDSLEDFNLL